MTATQILVVNLDLSASNTDLLTLMWRMKTARVDPRTDHVVCTVNGFGSDPRELWQVPEAVAFARRLVALGFVSFLDLFATLSPTGNPALRGALGAAEVYLLGENRLRPTVPLTKALLDEVQRMLLASNVKAEATVGWPGASGPKG